MKSKKEKVSKTKYTRLGACTISKKAIDTNSIKWCVRENPKHTIDSGWVFMCEQDTEESLNIDGAWVIKTIEDVMCIEPAIVGILNLDFGSDLTLINDINCKYFVDSITGRKIYPKEV